MTFFIFVQVAFLTTKHLSPLGDQELIRKHQETKDLQYLTLLFERYLHLIYGVCLKYLKDPDDSQDATMQIYEKLRESLARDEIVNFSGWLHVTTRNHCLMWLRSTKSRDGRNQKFVEDVENSYSLHHIEGIDLEESLSSLEKAIAKLPLEQKSCIDLFYLQQKCYKEIVGITGYDQNQVKSFLQNGRRNLKLILTQEDGERE